MLLFIEPTRQIYSDITGKFVTPSSSSNNYILVIYNYNSNSILTKPFKTRCAEAILEAYKLEYAWLCTAGLQLTL